jgi:hypothetical protein
MQSKIPILFIIFNSPEAVRESMQPIRRYRPERLYIAADGPRPDRKGEAALCYQARMAALNAVDWPCDVHLFIRNQSAGSGSGARDAIAWMREHEKYGAIVTDDCVVSDDFLRFCEEKQLRINYEL